MTMFEGLVLAIQQFIALDSILKLGFLKLSFDMLQNYLNKVMCCLQPVNYQAIRELLNRIIFKRASYCYKVTCIDDSNALTFATPYLTYGSDGYEPRSQDMSEPQKPPCLNHPISRESKTREFSGVPEFLSKVSVKEFDPLTEKIPEPLPVKLRS